MTRINRFLSQSGVCSRRQADRLIGQERVMVNGVPAHLGMKVSPQDRIEVGGSLVEAIPEPVYLLYHKPVGVVCTHDLSVKNNLVEALGFQQKVAAVGRLDKDSEGLMLLTNNGELVNRILQPDHGHEKAYRVTVDRPINKAFIDQMSIGVPIMDTVTRPCKVSQEEANSFRIVLTQGLNRQIRRMCQALGYRVERLQRTRIMNLYLEDLAAGDWRKLTVDERDRLIKNTANNI